MFNKTSLRDIWLYLSLLLWLLQSEVCSRVPSRPPLLCRLVLGTILLGHWSNVLRCVALRRFPLHARHMARPDLHRQLYSPGPLRLLQRFGRKTRTEATTQILAQKWFRVRYTVCHDQASLQKRHSKYSYLNKSHRRVHQLCQKFDNREWNEEECTVE